jgi:GH24 family phage-related lysozyme (muramidase)
MRNSRKILLFESWSVSQLADRINTAAAGPGTDEIELTSAIQAIPDKQTVVQINALMSGSDKYAYKTIDAVLKGELGYFDDDYIETINIHLDRIGAKDLIALTALPITPPEKIIAGILPRVKQHEGVKSKVYLDSRGIPTIGVGFNLNRQDSLQRLNSIGVNYQLVKSGKAALSDSQISTLLMQDLNSAYEQAKSLIPNWDSLPDQIKGVLTEMAFNLGKQGLSEFKNFLSYITAYDYDKASTEMLRSSWARQVGNRATTLSKIVQQA